MAGRPGGSGGMSGTVVGDSAISDVGGEQGTLVYRGFDIRELVPGVPYESVVHLLALGEIPSEDPSARVRDELAARRTLPRSLAARAAALPTALPPLDALRTLLSMIGDGSYDHPPTLAQGFDLIAYLPVLLTGYVARCRDSGPPRSRPELGHVANYLAMLHGADPDPAKVRALEGYFVLLADHGMNASTFALRVAISTQSDLISAATAALSVLKGPLHGGAPSRVTEMLDAIGTAERADRAIAERLSRGEVLYGFGHRVYKAEDPRALLLHRLARGVADPARLALAEAVERAALDALRRAKPGARLFTNVEYYGAVLLEAVGIPPECMTATFALARTAGWTAHALEQATDRRVIRPDVRYTGPPAGRRWPRPRPSA